MTMALLGRGAEILDSLKGFFQNFGNVGYLFLYLSETVFFFAILFLVSKVLRDNGATKLMVVYWGVIVAGYCIYFIDFLIGGNNINKQFLLIYVILVSAIMLILFNVEVKKYFWDVHKVKANTDKGVNGHREVRTQADTDRCIKAIIASLQNMSKNNVGALIVLSKGNLPKTVFESGIEINAEISTQMIEGTFFPNSPLHDGAMIIRGHKIQSASCFLPTTQRTSYPNELGTRHRAAIGITEVVANVRSLVVSEETGIISIVKQGEVTRYADSEMLTKILTEYYNEIMGGNK